MKTTLNIDDALLRRAKRKAAERGTTLTSLVEEGLREVLSPRRDGGKAFRLRLPVVPGRLRVDVADREALYAVMEEPT